MALKPNVEQPNKGLSRKTHCNRIHYIYFIKTIIPDILIR